MLIARLRSRNPIVANQHSRNWGNGHAVERIAGDAFGPHHQALLVGDREAHLDAEFVAVAGLALAETAPLSRATVLCCGAPAGTFRDSGGPIYFTGLIQAGTRIFDYLRPFLSFLLYIGSELFRSTADRLGTLNS